MTGEGVAKAIVAALMALGLFKLIGPKLSSTGGGASTPPVSTPQWCITCVDPQNVLGAPLNTNKHYCYGSGDAAISTAQQLNHDFPSVTCTYDGNPAWPPAGQFCFLMGFPGYAPLSQCFNTRAEAEAAIAYWLNNGGVLEARYY